MYMCGQDIKVMIVLAVAERKQNVDLDYGESRAKTLCRPLFVDLVVAKLVVTFPLYWNQGLVLRQRYAVRGIELFEPFLIFQYNSSILERSPKDQTCDKVLFEIEDEHRKWQSMQAYAASIDSTCC